MAPLIPPQGLPSLVIPFAYLSYCNQKKQIHYIAIMPAANGIDLGALITQFRDDQSQHNATRIEHAYSQLGYELGNFHKHFMTSSNGLKIGKTITHGDFHCSNIFYDETENHCTFIDNETIALSVEHGTDPSKDITKLFLDFFSIQANSRKNIIKGIDLALWHTIALKNFIEGYVRAYQPNEQVKALRELKIIFNTDYDFSWFRFKPFLLEQLRNNYINPIFDDIEKILWHRGIV